MYQVSILKSTQHRSMIYVLRCFRGIFQFLIYESHSVVIKIYVFM